MGALWPSVLAGLGIGLPMGWLLSYLGALPFFLGLFFYMIFGLVIGAVMVRVGQGRGRFEPRRLRLASGLVVGAVWGTALTLEAHGFPRDQAGRGLERLSALPTGTEREQVVEQSREFLTQHLREHYPPGSAIGYFRWRLTGGRIAMPVAGLRQMAIEPDRWRWSAQAVISLLLLTFGVHSQVSGLAVRPGAAAAAAEPAQSVT